MGKKQKCPEFENHERWLVSYADMVTLLFAVFVVLYSLNMSGGEKKEEKAAGSMQESFSTPLEDIPLDRKSGPGESGFGIFQHFQGNQIRKPITDKFPSPEASLRIIDTEYDAMKSKLEDRLYGPEKHREGSDTGEARIVEVIRTPEGYRFQLLAKHFFDAGSKVIKSRAKRELDEVAKILKDLGRSISIEGHTDSSPTRGRYDNWDLSALRATQVLRYFISNHHFPPTKISAAGYAEYRPAAHNGTESGRALNRRIDIKVEYEQNAPNL